MGILNFVSPEILTAIGAFFAVIVAFFAGGQNAKNKDRAKRAEADRDAVIERKELNNDLENMDHAARRKRIGKWVRPPK